MSLQIVLVVLILMRPSKSSTVPITDGANAPSCGAVDSGLSAVRQKHKFAQELQFLQRDFGTNVISQVPTSSQPARAEPCPTVAYLRIQKTGSTTFGMAVMPTLCNKTGQTCRGQGHRDYLQAVAAAGSEGCVVTLLRDPVERVLSEFSMARGSESTLLESSQWDWAPEDLPILWRLSGRGKDSIQNSTVALEAYISEPANPSRNRQTMYLVGFQRVADGGRPVAAFDWDARGQDYLKLAKAHLSGLLAFGFTDCYSVSMAAIAERAGWNKREAKVIAETVQMRNQERKQHDISRHAAREVNLVARVDTTTDRACDTAIHYGSGAKFLPLAILAEIRRRNSVDLELVDWARSEFYRRHGKKCERQE